MEKGRGICFCFIQSKMVFVFTRHIFLIDLSKGTDVHVNRLDSKKYYNILKRKSKL